MTLLTWLSLALVCLLPSFSPLNCRPAQSDKLCPVMLPKPHKYYIFTAYSFFHD